MTSKGYKEHVVDAIINERWHSQGSQYFVHWKNFGPEYDKWIPRHRLLDNPVLDNWEALVKVGMA